MNTTPIHKSSYWNNLTWLDIVIFWLIQAVTPHYKFEPIPKAFQKRLSMGTVNLESTGDHSYQGKKVASLQAKEHAKVSFFNYVD